MKKLYFILISLCFSVSAFAQPIDAPSLSKLQSAEDNLKITARKMVLDTLTSVRIANDTAFIRPFVQSLKTPYSFHYPFDSLNTISKLYAPDSSFRIFTWQLEIDDYVYRQKGAIQMNTKDGSLKLFPLFDVSEFTENPNDSTRDINNWVGAIYYKIILKTYNNKNYYTLLGFDDNAELSAKKWIDVLTFDSKGIPQFGGKYFNYKMDRIKPRHPAYRFNIEYKKDANPRLIYDAEKDMIVFSHLVSENKTEDDRTSLIPDGEYEGFKWDGGKWKHVPNVFEEYEMDMKNIDPMLGNAPTEKPLFDKKGKRKKDKE